MLFCSQLVSGTITQAWQAARLVPPVPDASDSTQSGSEEHYYRAATAGLAYERVSMSSARGTDDVRFWSGAGQGALGPLKAGPQRYRAPARKLTHARGETTRWGYSGRLESRTSTADGRKAASTHSVVLPPLYDDLNQTSPETG